MVGERLKCVYLGVYRELNKVVDALATLGTQQKE